MKDEISYLTKHPWNRHYSGARERCKPKNKYGKKGIKFFMTVEDFKELWFRDKAYLLKQPSIDRIENKGDYIITNCQFIEHSENSGKDRRSIPRTKDEKHNISIGSFKTKLKKRHPISQFTLGGKLVKKYSSILEAHRITGFSDGNISQVVSGVRKTAGGFKWTSDRKQLRMR